jgi:uroporphyrinogen-III synthase
MLGAEGALAWRCPLVQICDLDDTRDAETWIAQLIAGTFQDVIWLTAEGLRRLLPIAEAKGKRADFTAALARVRHVTRGPKPARALREFGVTPGLAATMPTSQGVTDVLAREDLAGRRIGVQLYPGGGAGPLLAQLRDFGAVLYPVTPYRYAGESEAARVADAIRLLASGAIHMIAFTSSPQVDRLMAVATEAGAKDMLLAALRQARIAAVGPVVEERLRQFGVEAIIRPEASFHLKPLVRAMADAWTMP